MLRTALPCPPRLLSAALLLASSTLLPSAHAQSQASQSQLTTQARAQAATATANNAGVCQAIGDFYWEIGDGQGAQASGQIGSSYGPDKVISIASASKFVWGAYVVERMSKNGGLTNGQVQELEMRSGMTSFNPIWCFLSRSVDGCLSSRSNGVQTQSNIGRFYYGGGHDQRLAAQLGMGRYSADQMTQAVRSVLGNDLGFDYERPQPAGGMESSPADFAKFLRKIINGDLQYKRYLGYEPVCTLPAKCATAAYSPVPEAWHYSLNHWIEDDPATGDGSFSSPGLEGFYPWISADKTTYGILARQKLSLHSYWESVLCGRTIRKAWMTGQAQS